MGGGLRYFGGAVAFGFAAIWIMASLTAALVCLLSAVIGYGVGFAAERTRGRVVTRASNARIAAPTLTSAAPEATMPVWAETLNSDLGHIYEPSATTSPLSRGAEYGWPHDDETVITGGTLQ